MAAQITALPSVPTRQDPTNFNDRADAFLGALPTFQSEANALSIEVNTRADTVEASASAVLAATNITKWVSGTTYAQGAVVWSPINGLGYRRITASGSGTTDPSLDTTNYKQVNGTGDVSTSGNQTIAGNKTFTGTTSMQAVTVTNISGIGAEQPGMIAHFAMSSAPAGWLKANGAAVSRSTYSTLFAAIGTLYGAGDGSTTFNLPDLRGEFLRGFDDARGVDSGRVFGSAQSAYAGSFYFKTTAEDGDGQTGTNKPVQNIEINGIAIVNNGVGEGTVVVTPGDSRPRNVSVLACIKY